MALCPCGTTGEGATLDSDEHRRVVETCVEVGGGPGAGHRRLRLERHRARRSR